MAISAESPRSEETKQEDILEPFPTRSDKPFPPLYQDSQLFMNAITKTAEITPLRLPIFGITLPHHLLAIDLIAEGFALLRTQPYTRIIILSPDHNKFSKTPFAIPGRNFSTTLGPISLDTATARQLLRNNRVSESNLFSHEHGVQALLPFIAYHFPDVPIMPIALNVYSRQEDWDSLIASLQPLLTKTTLVLQSTDFSHYLTWRDAQQKDSETLRVIASGKPALIEQLEQPAHLDSKAAQYIQMELQRKRYAAYPSVIANHNSCEYIPADQPEPESTTSYIVQIYARQPVTHFKNFPHYVIGGDFFTGRHMQTLLADPEKKSALIETILRITRGKPLILNFEGVLQQSCPPISKKSSPKLCMPEKTTLAFLKSINALAVTLANNHSHDFGVEAFDYTKKQLQQNGVIVLKQGSVFEFNEFSLATFTDIDNSVIPGKNLLNANVCQVLNTRDTDKPLFAYVHGGQEFYPHPTERQRFLATKLATYGVSLFIGAHSHVASTTEATKDSIHIWSLGNFLFDQLHNKSGGAVVDIVFFPQGTWWAQQRYIGSLYNRIRTMHRFLR